MPRKKTSKAKKVAKKAVKNLSQTHGKEEKSFEPTTLDQIWGDDGLSKYKTLDEEEYEKSLREMGKTDLQTHATQIGLIPVDNRETLMSRLVREFKRHVQKYRPPKVSKKKPKDVSSEALKILREGR